MNKRELGFGGIQIVMSFAVIGLMAAVAVPQYQGFIAKAKMTEAFNLASESRKKVSQFYMVSGRFPQTDSELVSMRTTSLAPPEHVRELVVERSGGENVVIKVYLNDDVVENVAGDAQYIFIAGNRNHEGTYALDWSCGASGIDKDLLPDECNS